MTQLESTLHLLRQKPFEQWRDSGVTLLAVRATSRGIVNSAILNFQANRYYIYWLDKQNKYEIEND